MIEFIVFDLEMSRYIADIDAHDGDTDYTADAGRARIFRGEYWRDFWDRPRYRIELRDAADE